MCMLNKGNMEEETKSSSFVTADTRANYYK